MTTLRQGHEPGRHGLRALLPLLVLLALLVAAGPAAAAKSCGKTVIDDWFDGRIDGTYPLHCYDDAIKQLPGDVRAYSSAPEDIQRALQARLRGEKAPPNSNPPVTETTDDAVPPAGDGESGPPGDGESGPPRDGESGPPRDGESGPPGEVPEAIPPPTPAGESASSVPLPLILLAGLALLLLAGGAAGYVVRRMQSRRVTPPAL